MLMLEFLDFQVNVCPGQTGRIKAIEVTGRMTGKQEVTGFSGRRRRAHALASVRRPNCPNTFRVGSFHEDSAVPRGKRRY